MIAARRFGPFLCGRAGAVHAAAAACLLIVSYWCYLSRVAEVGPAALLWGTFAASAAGFCAVYWARRRLPGLVPLLLWAMALRAVGVLGMPILEDDYFRYLWDGYRLHAGGTPYGVPPAAFFDDASVPMAMQRVLDRINYPDVPTIYGPLQQALFALSYRLAPASVRPLQCLLAAIDLGVLVLLWRLGAHSGAWLYALSPLVVKEIAFTAHPDGLHTGLLLLALGLRGRGRARTTGACCGLALSAKIVALPLVPFLLWRAPWQAWLCAVLVCTAVYLPFLAQATDWAGLGVFAQDWVFNPLLFGLFRDVLPPTVARTAAVGVFCAGWFALLLGFHRSTNSGWHTPPCAAVLSLLLLCAPVVNPWYLLWVLPFVALGPSALFWLCAPALTLSYLHDSADFSVPAWAHRAQLLSLGTAFLGLVWHRISDFGSSPATGIERRRTAP